VTVVATLVTRSGAWMGSDSLSSDEVTCSNVTTPKCGWFGDKLIGYAGSWDGQRVLDIAHRNPDLSYGEILFRAGTLDKDIALLCVENGRIIFSQSNKEMLVRRARRGVSYDAIGSGAPHALGALFVSHAGERSLRDALLAAAEHNPFVRGPFRVVGGSWR
jgi:hypothetical protein